VSLIRKPLLKAASLEGRTFHQLRHTYASRMLADGVPVHFVSRQLGHSSPKITQEIYQHWVKNVDDQHADRIDRVLEKTG